MRFSNDLPSAIVLCIFANYLHETVIYSVLMALSLICFIYMAIVVM